MKLQTMEFIAEIIAVIACFIINVIALVGPFLFFYCLDKMFGG